MPCKEEEDKVNVSNLDEVKDAERQRGIIFKTSLK